MDSGSKDGCDNLPEPDAMSLFLVYCPYPTKSQAEQAAKNAVSKKLAVCANIFQSDSIYEWKGELVYDSERVVIFKTIEQKVEELKKFVEENHPYELPAIITFGPSDVNLPYLEWAKGQLL